jgi:hypothetical protein
MHRCSEALDEQGIFIALFRQPLERPTAAPLAIDLHQMLLGDVEKGFEIALVDSNLLTHFPTLSLRGLASRDHEADWPIRPRHPGRC